MKKIALTLLVLIAFPLCYAQSTIRVYNWTNYMDPALLDKFTKETGINVIYKTYHSNDALIKEIISGKTPYDVVFPTARFIGELAEANALQPIDKTKIPNLKHSWPVLDEKISQISNASQYSINWMWGSVGIAYNQQQLASRGIQVNGLDVIFNPDVVSKLADCGVYIVDEPDDIFALALSYLNLNPDSNKPEDLQAAKQLMLSILPYVKIGSTEQVDALATGTACLSLGYSGDVLMARDKAKRLSNGIQIGYMLPKGHEIIWIDQMAIPVKAKNPDGAHAFINFLMDPNNNAQAQNYLNYASGNKTSQLLVSTEHLNNSAIYMPEDMIKNAYMSKPQSVQQRQARATIWQEIKKKSLK